MRASRLIAAVIAAGLLAPGAIPAAEVTPELVDSVFYPYKDGFPTAPGIEVGMTINKDNWEVARDVLPEPALEQLRAGRFEIKVGPTHDNPVPEAYVEATKRYAGQVRLKPDGNLDYSSYTAGLPFPVIREDDPKAGLKAAWNHRYYYFGETQRNFARWDYVNSDGDVERSLRTDFRVMYWKARTYFPASESCPECNIENELVIPHPSNMWRTDWLLFTSPFDVANFQFLQHRYEDDMTEDQTWFYLPNLRRVRRGSASQKADALLGSDHTLDDFNSFQGKVHRVEWTYAGEKVMLVPGYVEADAPTNGGFLDAYPQDPWELRHVLVIKGQEKDPKHPYSRRLLIMDKQTMGHYHMSFAWDQKGDLWKAWYDQWGMDEHSTWNKEIEAASGKTYTMHGPILIGINVIDLQREHATNIPIPEQHYLTDHREVNPDIYQVQFLRQGH